MNSEHFSPCSNGFGFRPGGTPDISRWWNHREIRQPLFPAPDGRQSKLICRPYHLAKWHTGYTGR